MISECGMRNLDPNSKMEYLPRSSARENHVISTDLVLNNSRTRLFDDLWNWGIDRFEIRIPHFAFRNSRVGGRLKNG